MLGGTVGEETLEIVGAPTFKKGDVSLVFVQNNGTQFVPLTGFMHGHFRITKEPGTGEEILRKYDGTPLFGKEDIDEIHARGLTKIGENEKDPSGLRSKGSLKNATRKPIRCSEFEDQIINQTLGAQR